MSLRHIPRSREVMRRVTFGEPHLSVQVLSERQTLSGRHRIRNSPPAPATPRRSAQSKRGRRQASPSVVSRSRSFKSACGHLPTRRHLTPVWRRYFSITILSVCSNPGDAIRQMYAPVVTARPPLLRPSHTTLHLPGSCGASTNVRTNLPATS